MRIAFSFSIVPFTALLSLWGGQLAAAGFAHAQPQQVDAAQYWLDDGPVGKGYYFHSPSGAFNCAITPEPIFVHGNPGTGSASCTGPAPKAVNGEDCDLGPNSTGDGVGEFGPRQYCPNQPFFDASGVSVTLPYETGLSAYGYTCISRETGVTCVKDTTQQGFHISRESNDLL